MANFETLRLTDSQIEVRDKPTGHVFTYTVAEDQTSPGRRVLSSTGLVVLNQLATRDERSVHGVFQYAELEMIRAGKIDRLISP